VAALNEQGERLILVFESTSVALWAEDVLEASGLGYEVVPAPKQICRDCGFAIEIEAGIRDRVLDLLKNKKLLPKTLYDPQGETSGGLTYYDS
jgi:hypothetical protein